jgi:hypothetical protein
MAELPFRTIYFGQCYRFNCLGQPYSSNSGKIPQAAIAAQPFSKCEVASLLPHDACSTRADFPSTRRVLDSWEKADSAQVAGLTEGVVKGMLLNKVLEAKAVLLLMGVVTGTGLVMSPRGEKQEPDGKPTPPAKAPAPQREWVVAGLRNGGAANKDDPVKKDDPAKKELAKLAGS